MKQNKKKSTKAYTTGIKAHNRLPSKRTPAALLRKNQALTYAQYASALTFPCALHLCLQPQVSLMNRTDTNINGARFEQSVKNDFEGSLLSLYQSLSDQVRAIGGPAML